MIKVLKQTNIISLIKLTLLSLIFCLPKAPLGIEQDHHFFSSISQTKTNSFLLPTNGHFEHKVLKKIPLVEGKLPEAPTYLTPPFVVLENSIPTYSYSKTGHFINSSFARGPPLHS